MPAESRTEKLAKVNYWEELLRLRDEDRERRKNALVIVKGKELPREVNKQGIMQWYMHPCIDDTVIKPFIIWVQEIPPGSRSGRVRFQGGQVIYIWKGRGYSIIDEVKYSWQAGDVVQLPLRPAGVTYQHYNEDPENPAKLICVEANTVGALGVDRGSGFEQLEVAPEYEKSRQGSA